MTVMSLIQNQQCLKNKYHVPLRNQCKHFCLQNSVRYTNKLALYILVKPTVVSQAKLRKKI